LCGRLDNVDESGGIVFLSRVTHNDKPLSARTICIFSHAIVDAQFAEDSSESSALEDAISGDEPVPISVSWSPEAISSQKERVTGLLVKHHLPVVEDNNVLVVMGILSIDPPYLASNCRCKNGIVLNRVRKLLELPTT